MGAVYHALAIGPLVHVTLPALRRWDPRSPASSPSAMAVSYPPA